MKFINDVVDLVVDGAKKLAGAFGLVAAAILILLVAKLGVEVVADIVGVGLTVLQDFIALI